MRKVLLSFALLLAIPVAFAVSSGGFPFNPTFGTVNGVAPSDWARISQSNTFLQSVNAGMTQTFQNSSAGSTAYSQLALRNSTDSSVWGITSTGWSAGSFGGSPTGEQVFFGSANALPITIGTNNTERIRIAGDGSLINLKATAVQVNGLPVATTGTFTATVASGCTTTPNGTASYTINGDVVTLRLPALNCTSNAATYTVSGLPGAITPSASGGGRTCFGLQDNGVVVAGDATVTALSSTISFGKTCGASGGFTSSGTKGVSDIYGTLTYKLN